MAYTTPAISQTPTLENWYRSQQVSESLLLAPEVYPDLVKRYGKQDFNMNGLTQKMGGISYIQNLEFRHSEENFLHEVLQFSSHSAGSTNAAVTLTLSSSYDYTFPADNTVDAPYYSNYQTTVVPVYVNQVLLFPDGTRAIVTAVSGNSVTVYPTKLGTNIPAVATTDVVIIAGNQVGEYATINPSRDTQLIWYFNNLSNMNGSYNISGNARAEKLWIVVDGKDQWFYVAQMNESMRLKNEREVRLLTDTKTTNTTFTELPSGSASAPSTQTSFEGMIPFIESYGNALPYNLVSFLTEQDWEDLSTSQLDPNMGASEYVLYSSSNVMNYNSRWIRSEMKNGAWNYGGTGTANDWVDFMFNSFSLSGRTFHQKHYDLFVYPKLLGAVGQPYLYMALGIPMDKSDKSVNWDDMSQTKNLPSFVIHYQKSTDGYSRQWEEYFTGGANGVYTEAVDHQQINFQCTFGPEFFAPNRWFKVFKS